MNKFGIGVGIGMKKKSSVGIPFKEDALFWLDGTVIYESGNYYFKDKTNNGRNFLITGKDFTLNGFPYKSSATISAPSGDSALIAADLNGFYYTSGTPNQIPVVACFQNTDYANRNFFRHISQTVDSNDVETSEAMVVDMVLYANAKTGDNLTKCNTYYGVPVEQIDNSKWVAPASLGGSNSNAGTKAAPYLTFAYALGISGVTKIYATSGTHVADNYIDITKGISIQCTGNTTIDPTNASYAMYIHKSTVTSTFELKNCRLNGSSWGVYIAANNTNNYFESVFFENSATYDIYHSAGITVNLKYCKTKKRLYFGGFIADTCQFFEVVPQVNTTLGIIIKNSKLTGAAFSPYNQGTVEFYGNTSSTAVFNIQTNTNRVKFHHNQLSYTNITAGHCVAFYTPVDFYNNNVTVNGISNYGVVYIEKDFTAYNNIIDSYSANTYFDFAISTISIATNGSFYNNKVKHRGLSGYGLKVGKETGGGLVPITIDIYNNVILGATYFDNSINPANSTAHMIFIGFVNTFEIHHNYCNGGSPGIGIKGDGTQDISTCKMYSNICKDNNNNFILQGVTGGKWVNCTSIQTLNILRHFSFGQEVDGITQYSSMKNCLIYGLNNSTMAITIVAGSELGFESNYNNIYTPNKATPINHATLGQVSLSTWQAAGYDVNSLRVDPQFTGLVPYNSELNAGNNEGEDYNLVLHPNTDWGTDLQIPVVQTVEQGENWTIGAYVV